MSLVGQSGVQLLVIFLGCGLQAHTLSPPSSRLWRPWFQQDVSQPSEALCLLGKDKVLQSFLGHCLCAATKMVSSHQPAHWPVEH